VIKHLVLAVGLVLAAAAPTAAQPASALGHPLPISKLPIGTVTVRVIAGDPSSAVSGVDVNLLVNGEERTARTDAEGRATFSGLPDGATVQAQIDGDQGEVTSDEFPVPAEGGVGVMLSTKPMMAAGGGMGGAPGMPQPRQISGHGRPESADPAGLLTIRLTYDDFTDTKPPADHPVLLVGYKADETVQVLRTKTDAAGRAEFRGLDVSGSTAYFAMTLMPRGDATDRLVSQPIQMLPGVGTRLVLSAAKRTSTEASVDDYSKLEAQVPNVPPGRVTVAVLTDRHDEGGTVELVDAGSGKVLATERLGPAEEPSNSAEGRFGPFEPDDKAPAGTLRVFALGGPETGPLAGAKVTLVSADAGGTVPPPVTTDANGRATLTGVAPGQYRVVISTDDKQAQSDPIVVPADKGGRVVGALSWFEGVPPRLIQLQSVPVIPEPIYVQLRMKGVVRKGLPFLPAPDHGSSAVFELGERIRFAFVLNGSVDDKYFAVNGQITIANMWWTPYRASEDGLIIPLPHGFTGGIVGDEDKTRVTAEPYAGFRIRRPLGPGPYTFQAGFSLPIDDGDTQWNLDLPWGTTQSAVNLLDSPGMHVDLPPGAQGGPATSKTGMKFFVVNDIEIDPNQSMAMVIRGLPVAPAWKKWLPRLAGVLVLGLLAFTVWLTVHARRGGGAGNRAATSARVQALMDELVGLEQKGQGGRRKEVILGELEKLWEADGRGGRAA